MRSRTILDVHGTEREDCKRPVLELRFWVKHRLAVNDFFDAISLGGRISLRGLNRQHPGSRPTGHRRDALASAIAEVRFRMWGRR